MRVTGLDHIVLVTPDAERLIAWYRDNPLWWQKVLAGEQTAQTA